MTRRVFHSFLRLALILLGMAGPGILYAQEALVLDPDKAVTQYLLDAWTTDDGLPQSSVNAIAQTPDGYLWLGTQEGLARFDGLQPSVFNKRSGDLLSNNVSALITAQDGGLWIGTRGGGLTHYQDGRFTTFTVKNGLPDDNISSLLQDRDGTLWIGTYHQGLARLDPRRPSDSADPFTLLSTEQGLPSEEISALYQTRDGAVWIGTRNEGLTRYADGAFTPLAIAHALPDKDVTAILQTQDEALWIGTRGGGLSRYADGAVTTYTTSEGLSENAIQSLYEDTAGSLWVGTNGGGLCRLRGAQIACLRDTDGLTYPSISALHGDAEGSLWIGTNGGGLNRLRDGKFTPYSTREGLASDYVYTIYQAHDDALWIGTDGGGVSRLHDGRMTTYTSESGLAHDEVMSLYGTRDSSVWIGTSNGLTRYRAGAFTTYTTADGLPHNKIWALYADTEDNLWIATVLGLTRYREGVFTTYTTDDGFASDEITAIAEDASGDLWVGTYNAGLHRFSEGRVVDHLSMEVGTNFVLCIYVDGEGTVWFSTREGGLHRLRNGLLTTYTVQEGLFHDSISQILEDGQGTLWLSSSVGLFSISKQALNQFARGESDVLTPRVYGKPDGLRKQEFMGGTQPAGWRSRDGRLWFPTVGAGVVSIHPETVRLNPHPPRVTIEQALANGEPIPKTERATVAPTRRRFVFHYVGVSLWAPEQVRYEYMLEGADEGWVEAGARQEAIYTYLAPGAYTFKVRARSHDGIWSEETVHSSFYLKPHFYEASWFYVVCVFGLLGLAFVAYQLRIRHLKRRERELISVVAHRTADLRFEKERTEEALQETEQARQEAERQRIIAEDAKAVIEEQAEKLQEMDRIKTRFFNNISHEFRTPLTLNIGPLENALLGMYGPVDEALRRQMEIMLRNARLLLRLINQLLDIAKLESGNMKLRVRHGNLVELLEGIVLSFTAFAEKKELKVDFTATHKDLLLSFDPGHLEKVFFNLLSNAIKFTPENGSITLSVSEGGGGANGVEGETVVITLTDTGPGIPPEALSHIFDRFQQVDGTVSRMQEGTGIGLSLVKELVELHGGTIRAESEVGKGTVFIVTLPRDTQQLEGAVSDAVWEEEGATAHLLDTSFVEMAVFDDSDGADQIPASDIASDAAKILVVDDNPEVRAYVAGCLQATYQITMASDGHDAFEKARAILPDMIVSDVMMPTMTGYELCRSVKAHEQLAHVPIILLTSRASLEEKIKGLEAGCDDYLTKPFNARELQVRVNNLLRLGTQKRELSTLNRALKQANAELREVSEQKSQLLRIAAHDMKNPLNGIREFAKILREESDPEAPGIELLNLIHTSSDQMLAMVGELLDSEALGSGELVLHKKPVSLSEIAEEVVRYNRPQAERKEERLILLLDEHDPCIVEGAWEWLRDALDNLVSNAIKYSPLGKTIWVTVKREEASVLFFVRDEGPGLTEDDKTMLFGKFKRLSAMPTSNESSTGLGLSIVRQIVEMHDGRVWAESEAGRGSTFFIELPCASISGGGEHKGAGPPTMDRESRDGIPPSPARRTPASPDSNASSD